jgi:hypothetical protein
MPECGVGMVEISVEDQHVIANETPGSEMDRLDGDDGDVVAERGVGTNGDSRIWQSCLEPDFAIARFRSKCVADFDVGVESNDTCTVCVQR